jgi:Na+/proline symporter
VPTTDDYRFIFLGGGLQIALYKFFFGTKILYLTDGKMRLFLSMHFLICGVVLNLHTNCHSELYKVETDHAEPTQGLHCPIVVSVGKRESEYPVALHTIYKMA